MIQHLDSMTLVICFFYSFVTTSYDNLGLDAIWTLYFICPLIFEHTSCLDMMTLGNLLAVDRMFHDLVERKQWRLLWKPIA